METKWTPGPWIAGWGAGITGPNAAAMHDWLGKLPIHAMDGGWRVPVAAVPKNDERAMANANLIAAAPELYEALSELAEWHSWSLAESERRAAEFQRETGMLAPFKDAGAVSNLPDEFNAQRAETWRVWCAKKNAEISGAAWAALAKARGE